jgi:histidyl-tRNA synthetase
LSFRRPKGTYDVVPGGREPHERPELWEVVERIARETFGRYNYAKVSLPVFEETEVFVRSSGEASDIVRKEMFSFRDKGDRDLTLRPEGTAGVVRAYIEHGLYKLAQPVKMWYFGPMFRHERQQKGRYRQHTQLGAEVLGSEDPLVDVEVISLLYELHRRVGVREEVFYINNLGDFDTRRRYNAVLREFLEGHLSELDPDSVERIATNPMRTFDSKNETTQEILRDAPRIGDYLSDYAREHFEQVRAGLEALGVPYEVDERLVRGLDYYTLTVFEAKSRALGAQDTVGAGGRYNGLVSLLGGPDLPGIGFGTGVERILLAASAPEEAAGIDVFVVTLVPEARLPALRLATYLRSEGVSCDLDYGGRGGKGQFKQADRLSARRVVVLGEDELAGNYATLRDMDSGEQREVSLAGGYEALLAEL